MSTSRYYLVRNKPVTRQFRTGRRQRPTGAIVIHTAESNPDEVGPDAGAENVARFIRGRGTAGSYHALVDSDSIVDLVPFEYEAFHDGTGGNRWSIGLSMATQAAAWPLLTDAWVNQTIHNLAFVASEANTWLIANGFPGCPPTLINDAQYRNKHAGFLGHGDIDPTRRSDPGASFPWSRFFELYRQFINPKVENPVPEGPSFEPTLGEAIDAIYRRHLGRNPDEVGKGWWMYEIMFNGRSLADVDYQVLYSEEGQVRLAELAAKK